MAGENNADVPDQEAPPEDTGQAPDDAQPTEGSPTQLTSEDLVNQVTHNMQSFFGRRDKGLVDTISNNFDQIVEKKLKAYTHTAPETSGEPVDFDWENPMPAVEKAAADTFRKLRQEETDQDRQFQEDLLVGMGSYMDSNPLFSDQEFGKSVLETAIKNAGSADRNVDGKTAGRMLVQDATMNVVAAQRQGNNALSGRPSPAVPTGNVSPPDNAKPAVKMPSLSEAAQKLVDRLGYAPEDVVKILGE